ncbi:hypothetical protein SH580_18215 [Coraliomargarita algicola]|uniref:PEP-CTERM protein-sorting domain-containing protein n=1 Tax=Coraliomargarita algicola TaxID=3092156 RepID=A0ABZ0RR00_9BACT|nr:hypothetical protein [Coraliomargarita sp. J2-16]WPJ95359.1 hypothetical protein SH580_18215 [Coraliomargarita sp. J2-16]
MTMNYSRSLAPVFFSVLVALSAAPVFLNAAEISNPTLYTSMDPDGARDITLSDASNATSQATLEALDDFLVVRDFTGAVDGTNVVSFTDASVPDIQISFGGTANGASSGSIVTNSGFITSAGSGIRAVSGSNDAGTIIGTIDFGSWSGSTFASNVNAVSAAAFTLSQPGRWVRIDSVVVTFLGIDDSTVLNTQTILGSSITDKDSNQGLYFGYKAGSGEAIGSAVLTVNLNDVVTGDNPLMGLDDISFAAIPEPATSVSLLGGMVLLMSVAMRRR